MGMSLSTEYKIITIEEHNKLENKELYFLNEYDLKLIDKDQAKDIINSQYLQIFEEYMINYPEEIIENLKQMFCDIDIEEPFSMKTFINDYLGVYLEDAPITLEDWLANDVDYYSMREIYKETIGDNKFYLLITSRYW